MRVAAAALPIPTARLTPLATYLGGVPWVGAAPRLPRRPQPLAAAVPALDSGFFFPMGAAPTWGTRAFRRMRLRVGHAPRPRASVRRALGLWEVLGGGRLKTPNPLPGGPSLAGALLRGPNFSLSLRRNLGGRRAPRPRLRRARRLRAYRALRTEPAPGTPTAGLGERVFRRLLRGRRLRGGAPRPIGDAIGAAPAGGPSPAMEIPWAGPRPRRHAGRPLPVPQVRYKPGLPRFWRALRLQFCLAWGLPWARQRRLTQFIAQLRGVTGMGFIQMCLGGLGVLVKESGLTRIADMDRGGWVNGRLIRNPFFQLYQGDRVVVGPTAGVHPRRDLQWLAYLKTAPLEVWEVDGLTRSVTVLSDPAIGARPLIGRPTPFLTFRMYN